MDDIQKQTSENTELIPQKKYWRSLEEYRNEPEWADLADKEFTQSPWFEEDIENFEKESGEGGWARREFLKLMGASLALSSFACVRRPVQKIVPYVHAPSDIIPGVANYYASSWVHRGEVYGLVVKTREGRPIKLDGMSLHPSNQGALSPLAQAQVLGLYDPERLNGPRKFDPKNEHPFRRTQEPEWQDLDKDVVADLKKGGVYLLTSSFASPSTQSVIQNFSRVFGAQHVSWDPIGYDDVAQGQEVSYGQNIVPRYRFEKAKMIVTVEADPLSTYQLPTEYARGFSETRRVNKTMAMLVSFESLLTLTGMNSDFRVRIKPSQQITVLMGLAYELVVKGKKGAYAQDSQALKTLKPYANAAEELGIEKALLAQIAEDLWNHRGESLVVAGGLATRTEAGLSVQIAANFLNSVLGNDGTTVDYRNYIPGFGETTSSLKSLISKMKSGQVKTLIVQGVNPAYVSEEFKAVASNVGTLIYMGDRLDETGHLAKYIAPDHHHLENWGDAESAPGVLSLQQPTIRPLYNTRAFQDSLLTWAATKDSSLKISWHDYLKNQWKKHASGNFEDWWVEMLQKGTLRTSFVPSGGSRSFRTSALSQVKSVSSDGQQLVLYTKAGIGDGRYANISWLQELPDPVSKVTWDNYAMVSPSYAEKMHLKEGDLVSLKVGDKNIQVPTLVQPGVHDDVVGVALGYGREVGDIAKDVGVNAFQLVSGDVYSGQVVEVKKLGKNSPLANTQIHYNMMGRQIAVQASLEEYMKNPEHIFHHHEVFSVWPKHQYPGHKWAMSIDLNTCTGCAACVVACQSENNIPVVGKKYVLQGREMHWIRIDRYYLGSPSDPETVIQPVLCQHCDNAPCETVCPVAATTHGPEGLNEMTYNRCVGTRYCSNNCPYKVRRFNWFNYSKIQEPLNMAFNPDVTVRSRGVMEKCTFCVQRINFEKNAARLEDRQLKDGDIRTACEQSCPTTAIVFGDMNDPESRVSKRFANDRTYKVLEEFNTQPSVRYMAKIRNWKSESENHHQEEVGHS